MRPDVKETWPATEPGKPCKKQRHHNNDSPQDSVASQVQIQQVVDKNTTSYKACYDTK
jgi:hypothetical protein